MAEVKISELTSATTPLAGTETVPIVQGGVTKKVAVSEIGGGGGGATPSILATYVSNGTLVTGTTSATITRSVLVSANTIADNSFLEVSVSHTQEVISFTTSRSYFYVNTSNSLTGATLLATGFGTGNFATFDAIYRDLGATSSGFRMFSQSVATRADINQNTTLNFASVDFTQDLYFIHAIVLGDSSEQANGVHFKLVYYAV